MIADPNVLNVITCWSKNKHLESGAGRILIDDREDLGVAWEEAGGTFVHHVSTKESLKKLTELGIILGAEGCTGGGNGSGSGGEGDGGDQRDRSVTGEIFIGEDANAPQLTLFTKSGCTLCEVVVEKLREIKENDALKFGLNSVDITDEGREEVYEKYKYDIPVVHFNSRYWFKHRPPADSTLTAALSTLEGENSQVTAIGTEPDAGRLERKKG